MFRILYSAMLCKLGITYLGKVRKDGDDTVIYGYNKSTKQYSFWRVTKDLKLYLIEICCSKVKAIFSYRILNKGGVLV